MVFYGPKSQPYDHDLGPVLLSDCKFSIFSMAHVIFGSSLTNK